MIFFNKDKINTVEIESAKEEKSYDEMSAPELIEIARDDSLPFDERLEVFMKIPYSPYNDCTRVFHNDGYLSPSLAFRRVCIDGKTKIIRVDDIFRRELLEIANMLYDAQDFVWVDGYKRVNLDMTSKHGNFKYEIGKEYTQDEVPCLCNSGFHFCYDAKDTEDYYLPYESKLLRVKAYVSVSEKECSYGINGDKKDKCTCKRIKIVDEVDIEKEFPDEWADMLCCNISSYHYFMEDLKKNSELKERFKHSPIEAVMNYSANTLKYYYGDSLTTLIFSILVKNVPQEKRYTIFDSMIRYAMALTETRTRLNVSETISTLKTMISLLI